MKKILLILPLVASSIFANAQDTYIGDQMTVKVMPNTLFYHGGDLNLKNNSGTSTPIDQVVINDGNIKVKGDFNNNITGSNGKHFLNTYSDPSSYGQLIIADDKVANGKIAMERSKFNTANDYTVLGFPFQQEEVRSIINNMTESESFVGYCPVDLACPDRYKQTILVWDIPQTEYDAVYKTDIIQPGENYMIRLKDGNIRAFTENLAAEKFKVYGIPNNIPFSKNGIKSGIRNVSESTFSGYTWSQWKNLHNHYNETYNSYLGLEITNMDSNKNFGKNLHRFSNPYTSNLDLSDVSKVNSWIKFNINGTQQAPTEAYGSVVRFKVNRLPSSYLIYWTWGEGSTNTRGVDKISAYLQRSSATAATPYFWAGNPDALIIKPYEYYEIDYYTISESANGSKLINAIYTIGDNQKTFKYTPTYTPVSSPNTSTPGVFARQATNNIALSEAEIEANELVSRGYIAPNDFTQVELNLIQNNSLVGEAAYLVNGDFYTTGNATSAQTISNPIVLLEENTNGTVVNNSETLLNQFNSIDYIGKPLGISFKDLTQGEEYNIRLRLFEYSILNQVENFTNGKYYLLDKQNNHVSEVNAATEITFIADENSASRFELYWKQEPRILATDDLVKSNKTFVYSNEKQKFVRFENNNTNAKIEIFDLTGRLISKENKVNTANDYKLNLTNLPNVYVVVITYEDGKVVSEKILNK